MCFSLLHFLFLTCRNTGWLRLEGMSGGHPAQSPLLKQADLQPVAQDCVQLDVEYLQGQTIHSLSGQPVPVLVHPQSEIVFPDVQREPPEFQFVPIASDPVTGHY